ncbi:unnamed protein product [Sphagnum compactum]
MVNCWPRTVVGVSAATMWVVISLGCMELGRRLTWQNVEPQRARTLARDAMLLQKLEFRRSGEPKLHRIAGMYVVTPILSRA